MTNLQSTTTCASFSDVNASGDYECIQWDTSYIGSIDVNISTPLDVQLYGTNNKISLDTIRNELFPLPVNVQNSPSVQISTGANTVQLDSDFYPIPVIDQGTAPKEVLISEPSLYELNDALAFYSAFAYIFLLALIVIVTIWVSLRKFFFPKKS